MHSKAGSTNLTIMPLVTMGLDQRVGLSTIRKVIVMFLLRGMPLTTLILIH